MTFLHGITRPLTARSPGIATVSGLDLGEINSDTLPTASEAAGTGLDLEVSLTPSVQLPNLSYDPQGHMQRSQAGPRAHEQRGGSPESSVVTNTLPEQDVGVRHNITHLEGEIWGTAEIGG